MVVNMYIYMYIHAICVYIICDMYIYIYTFIWQLPQFNMEQTKPFIPLKKTCFTDLEGYIQCLTLDILCQLNDRVIFSCKATKRRKSVFRMFWLIFTSYFDMFNILLGAAIDMMLYISSYETSRVRVWPENCPARNTSGSVVRLIQVFIPGEAPQICLLVYKPR